MSKDLTIHTPQQYLMTRQDAKSLTQQQSAINRELEVRRITIAKERIITSERVAAMSDIHKYAAFKADEALEFADRILEMGIQRGMTPYEYEATLRRNKLFLQQIEQAELDGLAGIATDVKRR